MFERTFHLVKKEFIQVLRDKRMLSMLIIAPILQLVLFGYVATTDIRNLPLVVCDYDNSRWSREVAARFLNSGYFSLVGQVKSEAGLDAYLDGGKAKVALVIPPDFGRKVASGRTGEIGVALDGTNSNSAGIAANYIFSIINRLSTDLVIERLHTQGIKVEQAAAVVPETRVWYNPELKSVNFMVPGIICVLLMMTTMNLTAMAIVREKERGTAEQIKVSPVRPVEFFLGKVIPFIGLGAVNVTLITTIGLLWFKVPLAGSLALVYGMAGLYLATGLGLGLFISTLARSQAQAMMAAQFVAIPNMLLSGFIVPIANMPSAVQYITYLIPLRYFVEIVRRIFLKGAGMGQLWDQVIPLFIFGLVLLGASVWRLQRREL